MSLRQRSAQACRDSLRRLVNAGAFLASVAAVPCGSLESCEVAMPTVLLNS